MFSSQKPYLLRAMYEWMADNQLTPHIVIASPAAKGHVSGVPAHLLAEDSLTLNISPAATQALTIGQDFIEFHTRFAGQAHHVFVAIAAVIAIYDRDSQQGLSFSVEPLSDTTEDKQTASGHTDSNKPGKTSHLKIIK